MQEREADDDAVIGRAARGSVGPNPEDGGEPGHTHETHCLNCGTGLAGDYCHACGQKAHVHRTLGAFFHDLVHGVFHFEGKFWATLPLLAWKPGELTRRYIDGERARFVSPIALFLFCVFLTFAAAGVTGAFDAGGYNRADLSGEIAEARAKVTGLEAERAEAVKERRPTAAIDEELSEARSELSLIEAVRAGPAVAVNRRDVNGPGWLRGWIDKASRNPELLFFKLKTNAYKFSWALIPISVPFVWLLFPFSRRFGLYDHIVFVTYSLSFMMLLLVAGSLLGLVAPSIASIAWLVPPFHMYRQLRGTYGLAALGALWRTVALTVFAFVAVGLFVTLLVGLGELG